jgi:hypothetical protein
MASVRTRAGVKRGSAGAASEVARLVLGGALASLAVASAACIGLPAEVEYPDVSDVDLGQMLVTPEGDAGADVTLSEFKIGPKACEGLDLAVSGDKLDHQDLTRFFAAQGLELLPKKARSDLYWYEFKNGSDNNPLRLRLAILKNRHGAAKDLHDSLLQHGPGWWGVRRGNLAVLGPKASLSEALQFAIKYKLACWGTFTYAGVDDAYVVAGGYSEF